MEKRKDGDLDRQLLLAEQRREDERFLQEERQREEMEKVKAVEGNGDGAIDRSNPSISGTPNPGDL